MYVKDYITKFSLADKIYKGLTASNFSRYTPEDNSELESLVNSLVIESKRISLLGLWGGSKEGIHGDEADAKSLDFLAKIKKRLAQIYSPSELTILFCDSHHILVNGAPRENSELYYRKINSMSQKRNIRVIRLSDLLPDVSIDNYTDRYSRTEARKIKADKYLFKELKKAATKHSHLIPYLGNAEQIARLYVEVEVYFLRSVKEKFPDTIFFSFSDPDIQEPIVKAAQVSMLYFHSMGKGKHMCPWYSTPLHKSKLI